MAEKGCRPDRQSRRVGVQPHERRVRDRGGQGEAGLSGCIRL